MKEYDEEIELIPADPTKIPDIPVKEMTEEEKRLLDEVTDFVVSAFGEYKPPEK